MERRFSFAEVVLSLISREPFVFSQALGAFGASREPALQIQISLFPQTYVRTLPLVGEDMFRRYYQGSQGFAVEMKGAGGKPAAVLRGKAGEAALQYEIYFHPMVEQLDITGWLALVPVPWLLYSYGVLFFHGARVAYGRKAIGFLGASGAGKTTQADLWQAYGRKLSNDRVLLRRQEQGWMTYGYFEDGTAPAASPEKVPLGALVLPERAGENSVERLTPVHGLRALLGQVLLLPWDGKMEQALAEALVTLVQEVPVYRLRCTPDQRAADCLKQQLDEDGVMK